MGSPPGHLGCEATATCASRRDVTQAVREAAAHVFRPRPQSARSPRGGGAEAGGGARGSGGLMARSRPWVVWARAGFVMVGAWISPVRHGSALHFKLASGGKRAGAVGDARTRA